MSVVAEAKTVSIDPGQTTQPQRYDSGYAVIPLAGAWLVRTKSRNGLVIGTPEDLVLVEGQPYYYDPGPGNEISITNKGHHVSPYQKIVPYPGPIPTDPQPVILPLQPLAIITGGGTATSDFQVEDAVTLQQQATGLIGRKTLSDSEGMLMDLGSPRRVSIWMKNMLFPLDAVFIGADGTILKTAVNLRPNDVQPVNSGQRVRAVLEVAGGILAKINAGVGDKIKHAIFP